MRKLVCLLVVLLVGLTAQVAGAHYLSHPDPHDTEDSFDIERVRLRIDDGILIGKIKAYDEEAWPCCWDIRVYFDSRGDKRMDFFAWISWDTGSGGIAGADLVRRGGRNVDYIRARVDAAGDLRFRFSEDLLEASKDVRWRVTADSWVDYSEHVIDVAPDSGWFDH